MAKPVMEPAKVEVNILDIKIIIAVGLCILTSTILNYFDIKLPYGEARLDIIQKATAAISCLLCVQDNVGTSKGAGWMRIKVTAMAAVAALLIVSLDSLINNQWISVLLVMAGVLLTMFLCKLIKAPYMNCRIGAISYVLIAVTLTGQMRIAYALLRVLSTVYGVLVVIAVAWVFDKFKNHK